MTVAPIKVAIPADKVDAPVAATIPATPAVPKIGAKCLPDEDCFESSSSKLEDGFLNTPSVALIIASISCSDLFIFSILAIISQ